MTENELKYIDERIEKYTKIVSEVLLLELQDLKTNIKEVRDEFKKMNGTLRNVCEWKESHQSMHNTEDKGRAAKPRAVTTSNYPKDKKLWVETVTEIFEEEIKTRRHWKMIKVDKLLHFLAGYFIASLFQFIGFWAVLIGFMAGVIKELWDKYHDKEAFGLADLACTVAGAFLSFWIELVF